MSPYHIHSLSNHSPNPMVEKKKPSLGCQDLPEFYPLSAHCKMPIFMDLNVIPKGGGMMLVKEQEAQNNETRTAKPTKNETQKLKHDELDLWKNLVAASLKKNPSLGCQDLPEFYPLSAHCKMPIFMDLNVIPKGGGMMLVKEEEAQNNETRTAKPTKNETQKLKHDELDLWKNLVAASLNCGDVPKMTVPMVETTTKPLPSQRWKRQPALTVLSIPLQKRPEWLPWGWWIDYRVRSSGASAGLVDKYYFDPVSGRRFRSKKEVDYFLETGSTRKRKRDPDTNSLENSGGRKSSAPLNFEFNDVPENVRWVLTNASRDQWTPFVGDKMVPKSTRKEWNAAFHFSCS